jgi:hypothetical protein
MVEIKNEEGSGEEGRRGWAALIPGVRFKRYTEECLRIDSKNSVNTGEQCSKVFPFLQKKFFCSLFLVFLSLGRIRDGMSVQARLGTESEKRR